jgi:hypothetical protein
VPPVTLKAVIELTIIAELFMVSVQLPPNEARTMYVPDAVFVPKLIADPVPATAEPTADPPLYNW